MVKRPKVSIVGAGTVGTAAAHWIAGMELADVVLTDIIEGLPQGKALDILQAGPIAGFDAKLTGSNDYGATAGSDVVIITAGIARKPGMTREQLIDTNAGIVRSVVGPIVQVSPDAVIIMLTNPLDAMTYLAYKVAGFPRNRVVGQSGSLDSTRFRTFLAMELGVSVHDITGMVIGAHTDKDMVPLPRLANVRGIPISHFLSKERIDHVVARTRRGGAEITELSVEHLLAIRVRALELERRAAISAARETGEDVLAIDTIFALRRARLAAESRREQEEQETRRIETARDSERSLWTAQLQGTQVTGRRRFQLERRQLDEWLRDEIRRVGANEDARTAVLEEHSARTQEIKRQEAAQAAEQNAMVASQGVTMLTAMFGESKALAVAQAIINTYEGASKALAQGGIIGPVMAALIIATGLGYVKTIMAQEPAKAGGGGAGRAGGFDDPTSDMLARERGEAWAGDLLQMLDRGFAAGLARSAPAFAGGQRQAPAPPTIINQRQSTFSPTTNTNVSISGWVGAGRTEMAKRLQRELLRIDRQVVRRGRIRG